MQWSDGQGPFGAVIRRGARVLIKPNLVLHRNHGTGCLEPLVTHRSLISAVVEAAPLAGASEVVVGDAPLQSCDFFNLLASTGLDAWSDETMKRDSRFKGIRDFRRTTCEVVHGIRKAEAEEDRQPEDRFTLFDLGRDSLLEAISNEEERFRVTWYDPRLMARTHRPGHHQFLVAREILEAEVVINLPKLITCLDLNRILLCGQPDGSMADQRQRRVIHVVDAVYRRPRRWPSRAGPFAAGFDSGRGQCGCGGLGGCALPRI
jgi:hypothetical protein